MSEQPKPLENAVVSEGGGYKKFLSFGVGRPHFSHEHPAVLIVTGIIALLLIALGGSVMWNHQKATHLSKLEAAAQAQSAKPKPTAATQAMTVANNAGYQAGETYLDSQIGKTSDKKQQGTLYEDKSLLAINNKDYSAAFEEAQIAESLNPTINSAVLAAQSAENAGDKTSAIKYYQLAIDRMQKTSPTFADDISEYQNKIQELSK